MNIVTMSRAGAIVRLILQTLIAFGGAVLALVQASPDHVLRWWDWVSCVMAGLFAAQAFVNKAWAASSSDGTPASALACVSAPPAASPQAVYYGLAPSPAAPAAPVSGPPGAAQGVSGRGFSDVAADDDDAEADNLVGGREGTP